MTTFKESANLGELRESVKALDKEIIRLLGERLRYSLDAVRFKESEEQIKNPGNLTEFFAQRRSWAQECGVEPQAITDIYSIITENSIAIQLRRWSSRRAQNT